ncbi:putative hemolysin activator protein [Yersinia frederiksenii]|uniref:ShlB/FhaC/HecB family hemolysin secretion/activation protein n=1 Tax=Yersinia frederiksenii TaxID=29484 RepID=UPI0005E07C2C|nr:ShlB/FhaC/HecB family hemolysin secretion/activation protein [Yersinia frederiksenii]CNC70523.1 putative hemolysin activator protein [Yersinia frederiksenii]
MKLIAVSEGVANDYNKKPITTLLLPLWIFIFSFPFITYAKTDSTQAIILEQQQRELKNSLTPPLSHAQMKSESAVLEGSTFSSDEISCLVIDRVELLNMSAFPNAARLVQWAKQAQGQCLGEKGLSALQDSLQWQLVDDGYITSQVTFTEESYADGVLSLTLIPGRVSGIKHHENSDSYAQLNTLFPNRIGELANLRDIEQGLENLQRLPSVDATMEIQLNREDLTSQIVVNRQQSRFWRLNTFFDNAGHDAVGRYRAGATLFLDNPFSLSDMAYFSASRELDNHHDKGNSNLVLHYSVPFGNWLWSVTGSRGTYYQTLLIADTAFEYRTYWQSLEMQIQRLLMRGYNYKTVGYTGALIRKSNRFFADIELDIQRQDTVDWQLGLRHLHYTGWATITGGINYRQGTQWLGADSSTAGAASPVAKLVNVTAALDIPFMLGEQRFHFQPEFSHQYSHSNLKMQDKFSIGGRSSVRGFSTDNVLVGSQGWFLKNDIVWVNQHIGSQIYLGVDYGEVSEKGDQFLLGDSLVGAVTGIRGSYHRFGYDLNIGIPLYKPANFHMDSAVLGFMINWQY